MKLDNTGHMYVYEAVTVVIIMIAAIFFTTSLDAPPTVPYISPLHELETLGDDALRAFDFTTGSFSSDLTSYTNAAIRNGEITDDDEIISYLDEVLPSASYKIIINDIEYYSSGESGDATVSSHRIIVDNDGNVYNFHLLMWYPYM